MLCNLCCLKTRLRLLCNKYQRHSSLKLVSQQLKLCNIFIFGIAYSDLHVSRKDRKQMSATRFVSFPCMPRSSYSCNNRRHSYFTRNICNRYVDSFQSRQDVQYSQGTLEAEARRCSTWEGNLIHLPFIKSH